VLKAVPPKTMVAGSPARVVGKVTGEHLTVVCCPVANHVQAKVWSATDGVMGQPAGRVVSTLACGATIYDIPRLPLSNACSVLLQASRPCGCSTGSSRRIPRSRTTVRGLTWPGSRTLSFPQHLTAMRRRSTAAALAPGLPRSGTATWVPARPPRLRRIAIRAAGHPRQIGCSPPSASGRPASGGNASSSDSSSHNGASKTPSWLAGSEQRILDLNTAADRGSAPAVDPEPWVHNGAAGSGAEALARATLRSASAPVDVPSAGPRPLQHHKASEQRRDKHRVRISGGPLAGHTDEEASSSDDDGGAPPLSEADSSPAMSPEATGRPHVPSGSSRADAGSQRRADGSADYII